MRNRIDNELSHIIRTEREVADASSDCECHAECPTIVPQASGGCLPHVLTHAFFSGVCPSRVSQVACTLPAGSAYEALLAKKKLLPNLSPAFGEATEQFHAGGKITRREHHAPAG